MVTDLKSLKSSYKPEVLIISMSFALKTSLCQQDGLTHAGGGGALRGTPSAQPPSPAERENSRVSPFGSFLIKHVIGKADFHRPASTIHIKADFLLSPAPPQPPPALQRIASAPSYPRAGRSGPIPDWRRLYLALRKKKKLKKIQFLQTVTGRICHFADVFLQARLLGKHVFH